MANSWVELYEKTKFEEYLCLLNQLWMPGLNCLDTAYLLAPGSGKTTLPERLSSFDEKFANISHALQVQSPDGTMLFEVSSKIKEEAIWYTCEGIYMCVCVLLMCQHLF